MICKNCGMKLSGDMKFCPSCGSVIPGNNGPMPGNVSICRRCGRTLPPGSRFCEFCGTPVQTTISPPNYQMRPKTVLSEGIRENREKKEQIQKRVNKSRQNKIIPLSLIVVLIGAGIFFVIARTVFLLNNRSDYKNRCRYSVMEVTNYDSLEKLIIDSEGNSITVKAPDADIYYIGDNGISAGSSSKILSDGTYSGDYILFIIKDGQYVEITDKLYDITSYQLCGSGKKLFYQETDEKIYSYDTENGRCSKIYAGAGLETVSYNGEVIIFDDGYCKTGKKEPFYLSAANYQGVPDSGKHVYINQRYHRTYDDAEAYKVDFSVTDAASSQHASHTISESESIYTSITAHNADFNEILFEYDGNTYYYNDKKHSKTLICSNALLYPIEGFRSVQDLRYFGSSWDDSKISRWKRNKYIDDGSEIHADYDPVHSVSKIKKHVYCMFNDDANSTISIVYLSDDLRYKILVDDITADPIVSNEGSYIWAVSDNTIYRIDMTGKRPKVKSLDVNGLSCSLQDLGFPGSLPIALCDNGKNAYCIGDLSLYYDSFAQVGTLYYVNMESNSISAIDNNVIRCVSNEQNTIYYLNRSPESLTGTLYSFSKRQGKRQISDTVYNMSMIGKSLFLIKQMKTEDYNNIYNLYKLEGDLFSLAAENIDNTIYLKN